jgi:hypothetical protein
MRILNGDNDQPVYNVQLYLTPQEATDLVTAIEELLQTPEANEHRHVMASDGGREISVSLITSSKTRNLHMYTDAERRMFLEP